MKYLLVAMILVIAGCQTTKMVTPSTKVVVIEPPKNLFNCPQAGPVPNPATATNQQVAEYIEKLYKFNKVCNLNMRAIEQYIEKAKANYVG